MRFRLFVVVALVAGLTGCVVTTTEVVRTHPDAVGRGGGTSGVSEHVVSRGETLYSIAFRRGLDWRSLATWNGLGAPYTIYPGQRLRLGPPGRTVAATPTSPARSESPRPGTAQTRPLGAPTPPVASSPTRPSTSNPPVAGSTAGNSASTTGSTSTPSPASGSPSTSAQSRPGATTTVPSATSPASEPGTQAPASAAPDPNAPTATVGGIRWRWPTQGEVIQRFTGSDLMRQGIDIAGRSGQAVVAAADGEVVYSGSGLRGYGELIIIKHSADYLSAYGHNRKRLVAEGQRVTAGQPIAELGRTGTDRDKLHFEIRHSGKPVDPLKYLPRP